MFLSQEQSHKTSRDRVLSPKQCKEVLTNHSVITDLYTPVVTYTTDTQCLQSDAGFKVHVCHPVATYLIGKRDVTIDVSREVNMSRTYRITVNYTLHQSCVIFGLLCVSL